MHSASSAAAGRTGPGVGLKRLENSDPATPAEVRSRWDALRGLAAGALRDFSVGESLIGEAVRLTPDNSYAQLCRASLLEYEDRYEEALAVARQVLKTDPTYAQAVEFSGHLLTLLDRDQEAVELLTEAAGVLSAVRSWPICTSCRRN